MATGACVVRALAAAHARATAEAAPKVRAAADTSDYVGACARVGGHNGLSIMPTTMALVHEGLARHALRDDS